MKKDIVVFIYGSLKRGFAAEHHMVDADFLGFAETVSPYALFRESNNWFPVLYKDEQVNKIKGELYSINNRLLKTLDRFEGHPLFFKREIINVTIDEKQVQAWCYFYQEPPTDSLIAIEEWTQ